MVHKVSLYADDLLLFLSDRDTSIPKCLELIAQFSRSSGYRLNSTKSVLFSINDKAKNYNYDSYPFKITTDMTDLGVDVTGNFKDFFQANFKKLLGQIKEDLTCWSSLPLSLAGCVNSVKIIILPKILYHLSSRFFYLSNFLGNWMGTSVNLFGINLYLVSGKRFLRDAKKMADKDCQISYTITGLLILLN